MGLLTLISIELSLKKANKLARKDLMRDNDAFDEATEAISKARDLVDSYEGLFKNYFERRITDIKQHKNMSTGYKP